MSSASKLEDCNFNQSDKLVLLFPDKIFFSETSECFSRLQATLVFDGGCLKIAGVRK